MICSFLCALFRGTLHTALQAKPYTHYSIQFLSYSPMHLWSVHVLRFCQNSLSPRAPIHPYLLTPDQPYCLQLGCHSVLSTVLIAQNRCQIYFAWPFHYIGLLAIYSSVSDIKLQVSRSPGLISLPVSTLLSGPFSVQCVPVTLAFFQLFNLSSHLRVFIYFSIFKGMALSSSIHHYLAKCYPTYR